MFLKLWPPKEAGDWGVKGTHTGAPRLCDWLISKKTAHQDWQHLINVLLHITPGRIECCLWNSTRRRQLGALCLVSEAPFSFADFNLHPFAVTDITMAMACFWGPVSALGELSHLRIGLGTSDRSLFFLLSFIFLQSTDIFPLSDRPPSFPPSHPFIEPDSNFSWWSEHFSFPTSALVKMIVWSFSP